MGTDPPEVGAALLEPARSLSALGVVSTLLASLGIHLAVIATAALFPPALVAEAGESRIEVTLESADLKGSGVWRSRGTDLPQQSPPEPEQLVVPLGGQLTARPDTEQPGRGSAAKSPAVNLASRLAEFSLSPEVYNRPDYSELQRIRSARNRASRDFHRATPNPMELTLLSTGAGEISQRRKFLPVMPGQGTHEQRPAATYGQQDRPQVLGDQQWLASASSAGAPERVERSGVSQRALARASRAAPVRQARPDLRKAPASVPAETRARPNDRVDSRLAVNQRVASLISASTLGGTDGVGEGGHAGPGAGSGGKRVGSRSQHSGPRAGGHGDDSDDSRTISYYSEVRSRLRPLTNSAFPLQAKLEGRGGAAVLSFRITGAGNLTDIRITRPSGIPEFDQNLLAALRRTTVKPPPDGSVQLSFRFDAINPPVSRR